MIITLPVQDAITAATVVMRRQIFALSLALRHHGTPDLVADDDAYDLAFDHHIYSAMSEFASAKTFNLFWSPNVGEIRGGDVGNGALEVRPRHIPGSGSDDLTFEMIGWLYGREGKSAGPWCEKRGVWFVPPPYRPVEHLFSPLSAQREAAE